MKFRKRVSAINDNSPVAKSALQESYVQSFTQQNQHVRSVGSTQRPHLQPGQMLWTPDAPLASPDLPNPEDKPAKSISGNNGRFLKTLCLALFFASLFGLFGALLAEASNISISAIAAFGSFCAACSLAVKNLNWRFREVLSVSLLAFLSIAAVMLTGLSLPSLVIPFALTALSLSYFARTRLPAILGGIALLALAYLASPLEIAPLQLNELQGAILTASLIFYVGLSHRLRSRSVMFMSLLSAYVWATVWLSNSGMNYAGVASFAFIAMAAQYKLGKAGLDDKTFGSMALIITGWILAFASFLVLQWGFLSGETNTLLSVGKRPAASMPWIIGSACAVACILVAGMTRHAHKRQSWFSIFISTASLGFVPFAVFRPDLVATWASSISGFDFIPGLGLIFAACGLVAAAIMITNGLRLGKQIYLSLGLLTLGAQIVLLLQPSLYRFENAVIFIGALILAGAAAFTTRPLKAE